MRSNEMRNQVVFVVGAAIGLAAVLAAESTAPRFLPDDPVTVDGDSVMDAGAAVRNSVGAWAEFVINTFLPQGDRRALAAMNANTLGEVPDSSWFTNRLGTREMTLDEIARGPDQIDRLDVSDWVIVGAKTAGHQAGFRAVPARGPRRVYQIEFDPTSNPEMATGAEVIGTAIYHALGYNVVETYLVDVDPSRITIAPDATVTEAGRKRPFTRRDLDALLRRAARKADGSYRATASPFAEGRDLGSFRYYGTRPDDPNDIYPHEHRRELRGNRVFAAWLNHDDSRGGNSLDMLVGPPGRQHVKHYMFDFGSILGSGTSDADHPWAGHEYVFEGKRALRTMATFGLWRRPFMSVRAPERLPAAGSFTADGFVPDAWKPHFPNAAFGNMQADDAFWAARIVAAFPPEGIRRIVEKARYSDPAVVDHVIGALLRRRARVIQAWLAARNPIVDVRLDDDGTLRFNNAVVDAQLADAPEGHELAWFRFDNETGMRRYAAGVSIEGEAIATAPAALLEGAAYAGVDIRTVHPQYPQWRTPVRAYFRRVPGGWQTVGIDREVGLEGELYAQR